MILKSYFMPILGMNMGSRAPGAKMGSWASAVRIPKNDIIMPKIMATARGCVPSRRLNFADGRVIGL